MSDFEKKENLNLEDNDLFDDEDINYQSYSPSEGSKKKIPVSTIILAVLFIIVIILVVIVVKNTFGGNDDDVVDNPTTSQSDGTLTTIPQNFENIELTEIDKASGDLILINKDHYSDGIATSDLVNLYTVRSGSYALKGDNSIFVSKDIYSNINNWFDDFYKESGKNSINVTDAYRSYETQKELFNIYSVGYETEEEATKYVQKPGHSEHHSGLCINIQIYENGISYELTDKSEYQWIIDNAYKYGFIQRYPEGKTTITGVNPEVGHFRYIGVAHATAMKNSSANCFESYIDLLRNYTFEGEHLNVECDNGDKYEIYFTNSLTVPVPTDREYTVSGNNVDGFIVTIKN